MNDHHDDPHRRRRPLAGFRNSFLTGLVVILPTGLTIWLIWSAIGWIDSWVLPLVPLQFRPDHYFGYNVRGVGLVIFLIFTVAIGWLAKGFIGRKLIRWAESLVDRMPVVRSIYNGLKQIAETVFSQSETKFDRACIIEYPRKGIWAVGFLSTPAKQELADKIPGDQIMTVFVPTTPNPTSGFLLYVPRKDLILLDMGVEDAAKLIISAGLVYPNAPYPAVPSPNPEGRAAGPRP
jgi:uncharacterized membrane protein